MKVAVVTPYCKEPLETLRRCHESVRAQTHPCTHILVADGHPRDEVDGWEAEHFRLPHAHGDAGDTPRGLAGVSALNRGFDAIAYLDADNWYAPDHVQSLVELVNRTGCHVGVSGRQVVLSTGELCPYDDYDIVERRHVDTNCYFITANAAFLAALWAMIGPAMAPIGDRIMLAVIRGRKIPHAWSGRKTLFYESRWAVHFRAMGREPPDDEHRSDGPAVWASYSEADMARRLGFVPLRRVPRPSPVNDAG